MAPKPAKVQQVQQNRAKYGICDTKGVNGSRGDLDAHGAFFGLIGLANTTGNFLPRFSTYIAITEHDHGNDIVRVIVK